MLVICNLCFRQKSQTTVLFLTNCRHVFCENCLFQIDKKCFVCSKMFETIKIDSNMPEAMRRLFAPLDVELRRIQLIRQFQMEQIFYYTKRKVHLVPQISLVEKKRQEIRAKMQMIKQAIQQEQKLIQRLNEFEDNLTPKLSKIIMARYNKAVMIESPEMSKKRLRIDSGYHHK